MSEELYSFSLPPRALKRGFWLYVWKIIGPGENKLCYVGMTGDVNGSAQSAFGRVSAHLGHNKHNNALRRRLAERSIHPEDCRSIDFFAFGPVFEFIQSTPPHPEHSGKRLETCRLERALWDLADRDHDMLNRRPHANGVPDETEWSRVRNAFEPVLAKE